MSMNINKPLRYILFWQRIMAKNHIANFYCSVHNKKSRLTASPLIMIASNQDNISIQSFSNIANFLFAAKSKISQMNNDILLRYLVIPFFNHFFIHFFYCFKRPSRIFDYVFMMKMCICNNKDTHRIKSHFQAGITEIFLLSIFCSISSSLEITKPSLTLKDFMNLVRPSIFFISPYLTSIGIMFFSLSKTISTSFL